MALCVNDKNIYKYIPINWLVLSKILAWSNKCANQICSVNLLMHMFFDEPTSYALSISLDVDFTIEQQMATY